MRNNEQGTSQIHQAKVIKLPNTWVETDADAAYPKRQAKLSKALSIIALRTSEGNTIYVCNHGNHWSDRRCRRAQPSCRKTTGPRGCTGRWQRSRVGGLWV